MPLPTTGLTAHFNAKVATNLWQNWQAGTPFHNTAVGNGDPVGAWAGETGASVSFLSPTNPVRPLWQSADTVVKFNGTSFTLDAWNAAGTATLGASSFISASAYTFLIALYVDSVTANTANAYTNPLIFGDSGSYFGLHVRDVAGQAKLQLYNWDGNEDVVEKDITRDQMYVVMCRHEGGNLYISLDGGAESSVASGNTQGLTALVNFGKAVTNYAHFGLGEFASWNVALTGTDLTDAISYFTGRWLAVSGAIAGTATLVFAPVAALAGAGVLAGSGALTFTPAATLTGAGALAGSSAVAFAPVAAITGAGVLAGSGVVTFAPTAALVGAGVLAGSSVVTFAPSGTLQLPAGALVGSAVLAFTPTATLGGAGALAGTSLVAFAPSAAMTSPGALSGSSAVTFAPLATLGATGVLAGSSQFAFTGTGALSGEVGSIAGLASLVFTPQGVLIADGVLAGSSVLTLLATGALNDTSAAVLGRIGGVRSIGSRPSQVSTGRPDQLSTGSRV